MASIASHIALSDSELSAASAVREQGMQDFRKSEAELLYIVETLQFEISILAGRQSTHGTLNSVVAALTTGIDAAVSQVQQTAQQFQATFDAEQSLERETDQHRGEQDGAAGCKQERCGEISNETKSMSIKFCWKKDFIEKNTQGPQPAEAVGASLSSSRGVSILTSQ